MVVKNAAKDVPMLTSKAVAKDAYNQQLSAFAPSASDTTDFDIFFNVCFSTCFGLLVFLTFIGLRPHFLRLYSSNNVGAQRAILPHRREGRVKWMGTVWRMEDRGLLAWSGLDGFLLVQVLRLMAVISVGLGVPLLLLLVPTYYLSGPSEIKTASWYFKLSILNLPAKYLWFPAITSWFVTILFAYLLYTFYRNFIVLRQAYLKDPSAFTPINSLQRLVRITGSEEQARKVASFHTKTLLLDGIHRRYDTEALKKLLDGAVAGPCKSVAFVSPRGDLLKLSEDRNGAMEKLEGALQQFLNNCFDSVLGETVGKRERTKLAEALQDTYKLSFQERADLLRLVLKSDFHSNARPSFVNEEGETVDSISYYHGELCRLEGELSAALEDYQANNGLVSTVFDTDSDTKSDTEIDDKEAQKEGKLQSIVSIADPRKFFTVSHNLKDLSLTTGNHGRLALVVMQDSRHASLLSSGGGAPLSRRPFSLQPTPAPAHEDVLWENVQMTRATRKSRWLAAVGLNVAINLAYAPVMGVLNALCSLDKLTYWLPWLDELLQEHRWLKSLIQGVIIPVIMNMGFALAPVYLKMIALYSGISSKTGVNAFMIDSYGAFLFFQSFVVVTVAASILDVFRETASGRFDSILSRLKQSLPGRSPIFLNMFLQRLLISLPMSFLRIIPLLAHNAERKIKERKTPRKLHDLATPSDVDMGTEYPGTVIYAMQVLLAFMSFAPINLIGSALFFMAAQFAYKYQLLYTAIVKMESGGVYWVQVVRQLLIGLCLHHLFLLIHFSFRKATVACLLMIPPLLFIPLFLYFLNNTFSARIDAPPQTTEEEDQVDALIEEVICEQRGMLRDYYHSATDKDEYALKHKKHADAESLPVREVVSGQFAVGTEGETDRGDYNEEVGKLITDNPYMNPVLFRKYYSLLVDPAFFPMMQRLVEENSDTTMVIKEEEQ